jgi:hypothetical protein
LSQKTLPLAMMDVLWYTSIMKGEQAEQAQHKITLSIPRETWEAMSDLARQHQRSFTKELVWALQAYVRREQREQRRKDEQ